MLSDIEIAQQAKLLPIKDVAAQIGIAEDELEFYGKYKAKLSDELSARLQGNPDGKLILVTAINPTPAGEGKTTTTAGLGQAMAKIGKKAVIALREPSLGPVFGIKGGAAGGGYAQVLPMEDINLHFTGDMHAITSANNLLCAMLDNSIQLVDTDKQERTHVTLEHFTINEGNHLVGVSIMKSGIREQAKCIVMGIERKGELITNPDPQLTFEVGDVVVAAGETLSIKKFVENNV